MIIKTVDNGSFVVDDIPLVYGEPYVFADIDTPDEFWFGQEWKYAPSTGGVNVLEIINPNMIRKHVIYKI